MALHVLWHFQPIPLRKIFSQEILPAQNYKRSQFKELVKQKTKLAAFKYLCDKQQAGKKGKYLKYEELQIADYLLPDSEATIEEKFEMFALRT